MKKVSRLVILFVAISSLILTLSVADAQTAQPDFIVSSMELNPFSVTVGEPVVITANVNNVGDKGGIPGLVQMWIDPPSDFFDGDTGRIDPSVSPSRQLYYPLPLASNMEMTMLYHRVVFDTPGSHLIWTRIDGREMTAESDETNNFAQFEIFVEGPCTGDQYEPDDSPATSTPLQIDTPQTHTICPSSDADWLQFDVVTGEDYVIETFNLGPQADTIICLYDTEGSRQVVCDDDGGVDLGSRLAYRATSNETVYVEVRHFSEQGQGDETQYDIQLSNIDNTCVDDAFEPDNSLEQATALPVDGVPRSHNFCAPNDMDWHRVWLDAGNYVFETVNLGDGTDTFLFLYDESGETLASNDDGGRGLASRITWTVTEETAGNYYISAQNLNGQVYGNDITYDILADRDTCTVDAFEPDNTLEQARDLPVNGTAQSHNFCELEDVDWHRMWLNPGIYQFETSNLGSNTDTTVTLYDENGSELSFNDDGGEESLASQIVWTVEDNAAGVYYISIEQFNTQLSGRDTEYDVTATNITNQ